MKFLPFLRKSQLFMLAVFFLSSGKILNAYQIPEHLNIGEQARNNYVSYANANADKCVGVAAVQSNWDDIAWGLEHEDDSPNWMNHFWNPLTNKGLKGWDSALKRAKTLWKSCLSSYEKGEYQSAYRNLGQVLHLIMDMGVPAHTNLDKHPKSDYYETLYIRTHRVTSTTLTTATGLDQCMRTLALISRRFDSDDVNGTEDLGTRRDTNGDGKLDFTDAECVPIANECYTGAIGFSGGFLKFFYDTIKPAVVSLSSPKEGKLYSGLTGIELKAKAKSYNKPPAKSLIQKVNFSSSKTEKEWTSIADVTTPNANKVYEYLFKGKVDFEKFWIRAIAFDNGGCDSLPVKVWIKVDSTRPVITNTTP